MTLTGRIESLLFVASRPLSVRKIAELVGSEVPAVEQAIGELRHRYNTEDQGLQIARHGSNVQMVTSALNAALVADFLKAERSGELTRPALETLTIIAYRGPLPKAEIDLIRGVNCALILRHLLIRGLIVSHEDRTRMAAVYDISFDFLRHLGVRSVDELPDYQRYHHDPRLEALLRPSTSPAEASLPAAEEADEDGDG